MNLSQGFDRLNRRSIGLALGLGLVIWLINLLVAVMILLALGAPLTWAQCTLAAAVAMGLGLLPIRSALGLGTGDALWAGALMLTGLDLTSAVALTLGVRLVQMVLVGLDGGLGLTLGLISRNGPVKAEAGEYPVEPHQLESQKIAGR
jgi:uncharacterized membrane protein YbhN (UPF0104 family)